MKPNELTCKTCDYLWPDGTCRNRAPQPAMSYLDRPGKPIPFSFPAAPGDGCGEHTDFFELQQEKRREDERRAFHYSHEELG